MRNILKIKHQAFVDNVWVDAKSTKTYPVINPADNTVIANVPDMDSQDIETAIQSAQTAFTSWSNLTGKERSKILRLWFEKILENADYLAELLTTEQGKPLAEAMGEIIGGANAVEWAAEEAKRIYGDYIPAHKEDARILISREPVGVVAAITPWNFPSAMIMRKVAPALAAGCTVVLKPSEDTPLSALALADLALEAGIPPGVLNVATCSRDNVEEVGKILATDKRIKKISFTGSTEVGKILMRHGSDTIKKMSLELGGNAPFIVFPSADLDLAVEGLMACKFRNAGQTCISANRIYIHCDIFEVFQHVFIKRVKELRVGAGYDDNTQIGPLINQKGWKKVKKLTDDAIDQGAEIAFQTDISNLPEPFYPPTVLINVQDNMNVAKEEIFGPVAPLYSFQDPDEAVERANNTNYGLASYIYSNDQKQIWRVSEALEYGMVAVNEPMLASELIPFGGIKESGVGREGSKYGIYEFTNMKYRLIGDL